MAVVVRNEYPGPFRFPGKGNLKELPSGEVRTLTEEEWNQVAFDRRGPGKLHCLWPNEAMAENLKINMEYYLPGGSEYQVRYIGYARQDADDTDEVWIIRRHSHTLVGSGDYALTQIQVLENVAWADRGALPWT